MNYSERPSAIWHMVLWGFVSGGILAHLYLSAVMRFSPNATDMHILQFLFNPYTLFFAMIIGALPGAVMGFFVGLGLDYMFRDVTPSFPTDKRTLNGTSSFTKADMLNARFKVYALASGLTLIPICMFLIFNGLGDTELEPEWLIFISPPFIAAIAASYAAHRYMFRLRLWSGGTESRKSKAKNDALLRLSDTIVDVHVDYNESTIEKQDFRS